VPAGARKHFISASAATLHFSEDDKVLKLCFYVFHHVVRSFDVCPFEQRRVIGVTQSGMRRAITDPWRLAYQNCFFRLALPC
jgi:hypothetical protein